ncbi:hypothetical protein, partial [Actinacidiphila oryziradicis]|uniref:hypothetical protein n=1 Tax=Actinacidiphila oryziradicis TaxID=2571141 RepID=UPI0023F0F739
RYGFFCFHRIGGFAEFVVVKAPSDDEVRHMAADLLEARTSYACVEVYGADRRLWRLMRGKPRADSWLPTQDIQQA